MKSFPAEIRDALGKYYRTVNPPDPPLVFGPNGYQPKPEPVTLLQRVEAQKVLIADVDRARNNWDRHQASLRK